MNVQKTYKLTNFYEVLLAYNFIEVYKVTNIY